MSHTANLRRLAVAKLRPTIARLGVLEVFEANGVRALYLDAVHRQLMLRGTPVSIGTVYRTVQQFAERGILVSLWDAKRKAALYCLKPQGYDQQPLRLYCPNSGQSLVLDDAVLRGRLATLLRLHGIENWQGTLVLEARLPLSEPRDSAAVAHTHRGSQHRSYDRIS